MAKNQDDIAESIFKILDESPLDLYHATFVARYVISRQLDNDISQEYKDKITQVWDILYNLGIDIQRQNKIDS